MNTPSPSPIRTAHRPDPKLAPHRPGVPAPLPPARVADGLPTRAPLWLAEPRGSETLGAHPGVVGLAAGCRPSTLHSQPSTSPVSALPETDAPAGHVAALAAVAPM